MECSSPSRPAEAQLLTLDTPQVMQCMSTYGTQVMMFGMSFGIRAPQSVVCKTPEGMSLTDDTVTVPVLFASPVQTLAHRSYLIVQTLMLL